MNQSALITMIVAFTSVISITLYYFIKVLRTPPVNPEEDSYLDT